MRVYKGEGPLDPAFELTEERRVIAKVHLFTRHQAELCFVIAKDCRDLKETDDVLPYILGYTAGNDLSARWWQQPENCGMQYCRAKSFDGFAPLGPVLVSPAVLSDPSNLSIQTKVNGELRQSASTAQMIFDIPRIIRYLSQGTTLRKGTVIMTGTPSGVAAFMDPPAWLKNGDVVEIEIGGIGTIRETMVFH
ncbi:hypothetical protein N7523_011154 [Penicillium sp. IBT 18751x]|nr:hypothetical protein N7523_011154 [Penicillium sp. IBT 18751x]